MAKERSGKRANDLRKRAEIILAEDPQIIRTIAPADIQKIIHELNVHQIELEMQNEELRRVQLELQEARDKYLNLYDLAPTGYFTLDHNSLIVDVNLAGSELLGSEKHRLIGTQFTASISPDSQDAFYFHYREVLKTGIKGNCELKMLKADGTPFHAQLISMDVPEKDGNINQCRTAVIDITERRRMQAQLIQAEKMSAVGTMAAGIAHELLNPMMGMLNFAQYCREHTAESDPRYPVLQDIEHETRRCVDIVRSVTTFSHTGKLGEEEYQRESLATIIDQVVRLLSYRIKNQHVSLTQHIAEGTPEVWIETSMQEVLLNLITNALDAIEESERKEIRVEVQGEDRFVRVTVTDSGCGIPPKNLGQVFDPFFTTKPVGRGTGLGLTTSRSIIDSHGGSITCESKPGVGTTFKIVLPVEIKEGAK